ncbi:M61 family metallopeptidase [Paludibaculum fermentans]|uniref:M61 family metallopeptidase n=1 Tax=Paludibaculum fermentans TaxID=1473598 RepID=A0A7S7NLB7_PALFE|nr:PDZ domain-containing protein [Paludibaculum fermentans]QOY85708.1 M61 family metallopeptidase [Paludibaculum fermentans]
MRTIFLSLVFSISLFAQAPVRYTLKFPAPHTHYVEVTAEMPAGQPAVELYMPVWTPGSYLVREYARNVENFKAQDSQGHELTWSKTRKNRWKVDAKGAASISVNYKVYAHEMSVQGNWVDAGFAMMNGAANFMTLVGAEKRPYEVKLGLPSGWTRSISGMKEGSAPHTYLAVDWDQLLDSPIYAGNGPIHEFEVDGKKHYLVNEGEGPMWDGPASARDVAKIVAEYSRQWGGLPYDKYVFFNMITESGGGLEHKNSTWMGTSRWAYGNTQDPPEIPGGGAAAAGNRRPNRVGWLGLVSHEYFHLWNVKRLRPVELGPFDYENETYTRSLWLAEGVTSYYGPLALRRSGLSTQAQALRAMSGAIGQLQTTPGRLVTSAESASYNAWIQLYRANENTANTAISYYTKGQVIGFILDAKVRKATNGAKSLDDVLKLAFERYSGAKGYTPEQFRAVASEVAGVDLKSFFKNALETTEELDYTEALDWYGLRFRPQPTRGGAPRIVTGVTAATTSGRIVVSRLQRGTAAYDAGLNVDDEILAVNGYRVRPEQWPSRLDNYKPGDTVDLLVARRDKLMTLKMPIVADEAKSWALEVKTDASDEQKAHLKSWLMQ